MNPTCPDAIRECKSILDRLLTQQWHDTHVVDALMDFSSDNGPDGQRRPLAALKSDLAQIVDSDAYLKRQIPGRVQYLTHLTHNGTHYWIRSRHAGNSAVLLEDETGKTRPARIEYIFQTPGPQSQPFIAVRQYRELDIETVRNDPFRRYPALRAEMWSNELYDELSIVQANMLNVQYASWVVPWGFPGSNQAEVLIVLSLSRVSQYQQYWLCS